MDFVFDLQRFATTISVADISDKKYYDPSGDNEDNEDDASIVIDGTATPKAVTIVGQVTGVSIDLTGANADIAISSSLSLPDFILNGSTITPTGSGSFSVNNNVITAIISLDNIKVKSGSVTTSVGDARIHIRNATGDDVSVTFTADTNVSNARIYLPSSDMYLTAGGTTSAPIVVKKDGSIEGLGYGAIIRYGIPGKTINTTNAGNFTINGIQFTSTDENGISIVPDNLYTASKLTINNLAEGASITPVTAGKSFVIGNATFTNVSAGAELYDGYAILGANESATLSGESATTQITMGAAATGTATVAVADGKYTISKLTDGDSITIDGENFTYKDGVLTGTGSKYPSSGKQTEFTFEIKNGTDSFTDTFIPAPASGLTLDTSTFEGHEDATTLYYSADGTLVGQETDAAVIVSRANATTTDKYTVTVKSTLSVPLIIDSVAAEINDTSAEGTDTVYTLADGLTVTASKASFTTTSGTVSDVTGTLTVTAGTLVTTDGDSSAQYRLAPNAAVTFDGETGSDGGAKVIVCDVEEETLVDTSSSVYVTGKATVKCEDGMPVITGLDAVGDKVEFKVDGDTRVIYDVIATTDSKAVLRSTASNGTVIYWEDEGKNAVIGSNQLANVNRLEDAAIVTSDYTDNSKTYTFLANGLAIDGLADEYVAAKLEWVEGEIKTLTVKETITKGVDATGDSLTVKDTGAGTETNTGTDTVYTLSATSHITAKGPYFTVSSGSVSSFSASSTLTLVDKTDSLDLSGNKITGTVDATALMAEGATGKVTYTGPNVSILMPDIKGATLKLGDSKSLTITEPSLGYDVSFATTEFDGSTKTLSGLDDGAVIATSGLAATDKVSITTAGAGSFTVNGIQFSSTGQATIDAASNEYTVIVSAANGIEAGTDGKNYWVGNTHYTSVSSGVNLTEGEATLAAATSASAQSVTLDGHDKLTNNGTTTAVTITNDATIRLAAGQNFTLSNSLGNTNYKVATTVCTGSVGTTNPQQKTGYLVTRTTADGQKDYYLLSESQLDPETGVTIKDEQGVGGELWDTFASDWLAGTPIVISSESADGTTYYNPTGLTITDETEIAYYNSDDYSLKSKSDIVAKVTKNSENNYSVSVTGEVTKGLQIKKGVNVTVSDSTDNPYTLESGATLEARMAPFTINNINNEGVLTASGGTLVVTTGTLKAVANTYSDEYRSQDYHYITLSDSAKVEFLSNNDGKANIAKARNGTEAHVIGTAIVTNDNGITAITGLDTVGEKAEFKADMNAAPSLTIDVIATTDSKAVLRSTASNGTVIYWEDEGKNAVITSTQLENVNRLEDAAIVTSDYTDNSKTYTFLANGLAIDGLADESAAAKLTVGTDGNKTLQVNEAITAGVTTQGDAKTVTIADQGTATAYTLAEGSQITANGVTFITANGVVTSATATDPQDTTNQGTLTLLASDNGNNLTVAGTVNVDASVLLAGTAGKVTYQKNAAINGAILTLGQDKSLTITEGTNTNTTDTVFDSSNKTLTGLNNGAVIATSGLTTDDDVHITTVDINNGFFTVNGITFNITGQATINAASTADTLLVSAANGIGAVTGGKNYQVGTTLYTSVSSGVKLTESAATLGAATETSIKSVTIDGHDTLTNTGATEVTISSDGTIKLAAGQNFTLGDITYQVAAEGNTTANVGGGTSRTGYLVTVNNGTQKDYYLLEGTSLNSENGVTITDVQNGADTFWSTSSADQVTATPIIVSSDSANASYNSLGLVTTEEAETVAKVEKSNGSYTVSVTGDVYSVEIKAGVTATVNNTDNNVFTLANGATLNAINANFTVTNGVLTALNGTINVTEGTLLAEGTGYNLSLYDKAKITFQGQISDSNVVTVFNDNRDLGDTVNVTGKATVTSNNGNAEITGLADVGEKAVIADAALGEVTYEVIAKTNDVAVVRKSAGSEVSYWNVSKDTVVTDNSCGEALQAAAIVTSGHTTTTDFLANGLPLANAGDYKAATLTVNGTTRTLEVKSAITAGVQVTDDNVAVTDGQTDTVYTITSENTVTAKGVSFTANNGTVSDVTGTMTVTAGTLKTNDGDESAAYNLSNGAGVSFETASDGKALVTALNGNNETGDNVNVTGKATVTSNNGNAQITGLADVGEKVVIVDGQDTNNGTVTYEVIAKTNDAAVVRKTAGSEVSYWNVNDDTIFTDASCGNNDLQAAAIVTSGYTTTTDFLANGLPLANAGDYKAATLTVNGTTRTLEVKSAITAGVQVTGDNVAVTDGQTDTVYTITSENTVTANGVSFTANNGTVSDVTGTMTVTAGTLKTNDGDESAAYNLSNGAGVSFETASDGKALVTALNGNNESGDTVNVTGKATVTSNNGNAQITGLADVGEKVVIKDAALGEVTYEVISKTNDLAVVRKTLGSEATYWNVNENTVVTDTSCGEALQAAAIVTSGYNATTDFLANGLPLVNAGDYKAATLTVENGVRTLEVKSVILAGVVTTGDTVTVADGGTTTAYTLADNSHVTASGVTFTTTEGVVSNATDAITLKNSTDSLTVAGTVNVDASALLANSGQQSGGTLVLRNVNATSLPDSNPTGSTAGSVTYQQGTAVSGALLTLGQGKSLTITEKTNTTDTVYQSKTLTGLDDGASVTTSGLTDSELASIATAGKGTFTVNGISFSAAEALTLTDVNTAGTITADKAITTVTDGANYTVGGAQYQSVSAGVALTSETATLNKGQIVIVIGHDKVTNNGDAPVEVSSTGQIKLASGMNFTMGETTYDVASDITEEVYVVPEDNPSCKPGHIVTVTTNGKEQRYVLSEEELSKGVTITDKENEQGELWDMSEEDLLLPAIPITVDASSESASYLAAGFATESADAAVKVTKNEDGTYTVAVTDKVLVGVNISGVTAALSDSGTGTTYKAPGGSFQLNGKCTLDEKGLLTFDKAGSSVTIGEYTYTLNKVNDKISVDTTGQITSLTDGEKVTVTKGDMTITYEVSGENLLLTKTSAGATETTTNLLAEGEKDGFIILAGAMEAVNRALETSKSQDDTGLVVNTEGVNKVTDGMLLDRDGQATLSEGQAIATVTIQEDDSLKYTAKENKGQEIKITALSSKTWDITASNRRDTIEYAGRGEASISAGAGNDSISITGSGDVLVSGDSGKNTIIHIGTGDATLKGGIGDDTIRSTHAEDLILGGAGNNTFIITNVETKVSDFTYGKDKAIASSAAGTLDISKVNVSSDGTISYSGTGGTGGSLDVSEQAYGDFYAVTLADADGRNKLNVGWLGERGGQIDASSQTDRLLLIGNQEGHIAFLGDQKFTDTLIGGQSKDTIIAGTAESSLWGGAGNDLIESNGDASHTIFFLAGDGNDTVTGFTAYGEDNADTLDFLGQGITGLKNTSQGVQLYHGSDKMILQGNFTADTMIQWESGDAHGIAKVGKTGEDNSFSYDADVTNYIGSSGTDTLSLGINDDTVEIWMDGSRGVSYDNVEILDASRTTGTAILAGGEGKNTIIGGAGDSSLWGGAGSAGDTLRGGTGNDVFYYGLNEGNDVITNSKADDTVMLYNLALSDIKGANIEAGKITITQQNGQHLTVNGQAATFTLSDGSTWVADHASKTWSLKE